MDILKDEDLMYFKRGQFKPYNDLPFKELQDIATELTNIQIKYNIPSNSVLLNMYQDGKIGRMLGFNMVNTRKHGADCKNEKMPLYLEVKKTMWNNENLLSSCARFNNANEDKIQSFKTKSLFLALGLWEDLNTIACIIFGQHSGIADILEGKYIKNKVNSSSSNTSISASILVRDFGFKIIAVSKTKKELIDAFCDNSNQSGIFPEDIIDITEFNIKNFLNPPKEYGLKEEILIKWVKDDGRFKSNSDLPFDRLNTIFNKLGKVQRKYCIKDMDTIFTWYNDGNIGRTLGFDMVNIGGGGVDCKHSNNQMFLEVKSKSYSKKDILSGSINFGKMPYYKAIAFSDKKMFLAISVSDGINSTQFIIFGQSPILGERLKIECSKQKQKDSYHSIQIITLLKYCGFKICPIMLSKAMLIEMIKDRYSRLFSDEEIDNMIVSIDDLDITKCDFSVQDIEKAEKNVLPNISTLQEKTWEHDVPAPSIDCETLTPFQAVMSILITVIGPVACNFYMFIQPFIDNKTNLLQATIHQLSTHLNYSSNMVESLFNILIDNGLIKTVYKGNENTPNMYEILTLKDLIETHKQISQEN